MALLSGLASKLPTLRLLSRSPATRLELLQLADELQDAATKIRSILADEEPGSDFVHNQMLQFGADRLEGDL